MKHKLVKLSNRNADILFDIRYATTNNFTGKQIYSRSECYLNPVAFEHLMMAAELAKKLDLRIKIFDAFRPKESQEKLWEVFPNPSFIVPPKKGSPHSRGAAVDITLVNKDNIELDMGTKFDEFSTLSFHGSKYISNKSFINRNLLLGIMTSSGWDFFRNEWWHYQLFKSKNYPLLGDKDIQKPLTLL